VEQKKKGRRGRDLAGGREEGSTSGSNARGKMPEVAENPFVLRGGRLSLSAPGREAGNGREGRAVVATSNRAFLFLLSKEKVDSSSD